MKKTFKEYTICWAILLIMFNVICFVSPRLMTFEGTEYDKFGGAFWVGYIFITFAFIGQLICAAAAFKAENLQKFFYKLPLITVSYTGLILTVIFGALCMAIPDLPNWLGIILCFIILAFNAIALTKASATADIVAGIDEKVKTKTQFTKMAAVNAQNIMNRAKNDTAKAECKKVYEALRYSDPMSNEALSVEEAKITVKLDEFASAVSENDAEKIHAIAKEVVLLVEERNSKCKVLK